MIGPYVCGDSIDLRGNTLVTGSYSGDHKLLLWDIRTRKILQSIKWDNQSDAIETNIFSAKFCPNLNKNLLAVCSSNTNHFQLYECKDYNIYAAYRYLDKPIYTLDFTSNGDYCAFGGADGSIRIIAI